MVEATKPASSLSESVSNAVPEETLTPSGTERSLPPIGDLLRESWEVFTKSVLNLFLLGVVTTGIYVVVFGVMLLLAGLGGGFGFLKSLSNLGSGGGPSFEALLPMLTGLGVGFLFFILFAVVFGSVIQAASMIIVGEAERKVGLGEVLGRGLRLVIPLLLTNLLLFFFGFGGFFVLILPAILFAILFAFVPYEVVLGERRFLAALKASYRMVTQHFGELLIRGLVWLGLVVGVFFFLSMPNMMFGSGREGSLVLVPMMVTFGVLRVVINGLVSWFGLCYGVILYKQTKAVTDFEREIRFWWVWVVAILGWVVAGLVGLVGYRGVRQLMQTKPWEKSLQQEIFREQIPQSKFLPEG